jgi:two-component system, NtrC family, sensor kinase
MSSERPELPGFAKPSRPPRPSWLRPPVLVAVMVLAVAVLGGIAYWGERREAAGALGDFERTQVTLAGGLAAALAPRLTEGPVEPAARLVAGLAAAERHDAVMVLLRAPGERALLAADGRRIVSPPLVEALDRGRLSLQLPRAQAAELGLPPRTAVAGLSWIDAGARGRWAVAVVASAERQRDRDRRALWRLLSSITTAVAVVLVFGGLALRRQRAELELQHALDIANLERTRDDALERSARTATLGTLAMGIAHEIATPLGVITARADQLAAHAGADERGDRAVRVILEQAARIDQVIRAFLALARGDAASREVEPASIAEGARALVAHRFARAGVSLVTESAPPLPALHGDPRLLEHALVNLLLNACDASPRGSTVQLRLGRDEGAVAFTVSDSGAGISPDDIARVTEPFFTTKPHGAGTGLGLAIVNEIVKHHRGALTFSARQPRGTVVRMSIPGGDRRTA